MGSADRGTYTVSASPGDGAVASLQNGTDLFGDVCLIAKEGDGGER